MNLRDEAQAKSRTFVALNFQVLYLSVTEVSFSNASSSVTTNTIRSAFSAFFKSKTSSKKPFFKSNRIDCVTKAVFRDRLKIFRSKNQRANKTY